MRKGKMTLFKVAASLVLIAVFSLEATAASVPRMTKEQLKPLLGKPDVVVVDVRAGRDWKGSEYKITGAVRVNTREMESWASGYGKDTKLVFYCA